MSPDLFRDSLAGFALNWASAGRIFPYADQKADYVVPERYLPKTGSTSSTPPTLSRAPTLVAGFSSPPPAPSPDGRTLVDAEGICKQLPVGDDIDLEKLDIKEPAPAPAYQYLVDWEENDPDRPQNWSLSKKLVVGGLISFLTFAVYVGSAIYTPSIPGLMEQFGVSSTHATAGLTLFVAAYGIGPMILAPMQELAHFGRNPVYILGLFLFAVFQIPAIFAPNIATVLAMRFLSGFMGSPALATGGASMGDVFAPQHLAIAIGAWSVGAVLGPVLGPTLSGFAVMKLNWRWSFIELAIIGGVAFLVLLCCLPETLESTILLRRAQRLRKLTGNPLLKAPSELGEKEGALTVLKHNLVRTAQLAIEPSLLVAHVYIALCYAILYLWFESFYITFVEVHHFNLGLGTLPYLSFCVAITVAYAFYVCYHLFHINKRLARNPNLPPEIFLELALMAAPFGVVSLLIFGWTSRADIHWFWPILGAALSVPYIFYSFQSILTYVSVSYPKDAAAGLAGNDLIRSVFASVFPLFGTRYFRVLGLGGGSSLLAGAVVVLVPFLYAIMRYGPKLRARSRFAQS
ncbi:hypothetical protein JCM6882_005353 [Rhodosporidiobolus microsporus]